MLQIPLKHKLPYYKNGEKMSSIGPSATLTQAALTRKCNMICCLTQLHNLNYPEDSTKQEIHDVTLRNTGIIKINTSKSLEFVPKQKIIL